jgi:hypothetical protein
MLSGILTVGLLTTLFHYVDRAFVLNGFQKAYYGVHVIHNAAMVALTLSDVRVACTDLYAATSYPYNWSAAYICYALHFYHIWDYWRTFQMDDWLHHVLMIGVALPLGTTVPAGALLGMSLFFTTGLPGGISYAMMFAERNGWMTRTLRKRLDGPIHLWIRAPGCVAHAALTLATTWSNPLATPWFQFVGTVTAALTCWNGLYFMEQVLRSAVLNREEDERADANNRGPAGSRDGANRDPST